VFRLTLHDDEHIRSSGKCGEYPAHVDALIRGQDAFGAALTAVIDEIVGIPSGAAGAHLGQPRPDVMRRATNRDGVIDRAEGLRNQVVSGKSPGLLARSGADLPPGVNRSRRILSNRAIRRFPYAESP
jgi:hypothetical protein